ncbi:unnamed protein product [Allacma fusca]|uniref:Uncharacterized protein n=1 Tax=Allacma fusca TaxID=39272 RepID=A0A8J2P4I6_9HEXA|nr:unnamed protein product [Allacma fusca]
MLDSLIKNVLVAAWDLIGKLQNITSLNNKAMLPKRSELVVNFDEVESNQLLIIFPYLGAKKRGVEQYSRYFLNQRFDVLVLPFSWYDAMWPECGAQIIAKEVAEFLVGNERYEKIVVYAFSGGAYVWGEVLNVMSQDESKYGFVRKRIIGQVFDSIAVMGMETLTVKFPKVIFPKSTFLQRILGKYLRYHTTVLSEYTTQHYLQSFEQLKQYEMVGTSILTFASRDDKISTLDSICDLVYHWRAKGASVDLKLWEKSPHVQHLKYHKDEYEDSLMKYLLNLNVVHYPSKFGRM